MFIISVNILILICFKSASVFDYFFIAIVKISNNFRKGKKVSSTFLSMRLPKLSNGF